MDSIPFDKLITTAQRQGAEFVEVYAERTRSTLIVCDDKRIEHAATMSDSGVGIRAISGNRTAYVSTNDLSRKSLLALAKKVGEMTSSKRVKAKPITLTETRSQHLATVRRHPSGVSLDDKGDLVRRASDVAWKAGNEVRQVRVAYRDLVRRTTIATSDGTLAHDEQVGTMLSTHVIAGNGEILQTAQEQAGGAAGLELFDKTPPEEIAERAARRAIRLLSARPAPAGRMTVILAAEAGGTMIHEAVGHGLESDIAGEGLSVYSGRIGEKVASDLITVVDDSTMSGMRGSFTFDDEGTPAHRTVLIENGVLKQYLTDRRSSMKYGTSRTGNGRRQNYTQLPIVRMTNTLIVPGKDDPKAILSETASGLFVKRMGGGAVNTVNGDFVFDVQEGYLIENGILGELVRGATLIGNGPKVLTLIDRVGTDLGFFLGTCGKEGQEAPVSCGQPTIRIPEIVVGGTA